jgi:dihydrofolate reductase
VPVVVISKSLINPLADNRLAHCWNLSPAKAIDRARKTFGENIHVESGISIIQELIDAGLVDQVELSITEVTGGEDRINVSEFLSHFTHIEEKVESGTRFLSAQK